MDSNGPIWYPFTQMKLATEPIHIMRGAGALLSDKDGKLYIDAVSSWWTNIHGHANAYIAQKLYEQSLQLEHVIFAGFTHTPAIKLALRLLIHTEGHFSKVFFSDNGSTAVEVALKMAIQYHSNTGSSKKTIIAFENSYHGDTFGSMSVSDRGAFTQPFHDKLFDVTFITPPLPGKEEESLKQLQNCLNKNDVAAFIYEPLVMGAGGMLMYQPEHLEALLNLAKNAGVICIADEVMTGFYRTGKMFASHYCETRPDIMCLSKGITGGTMALGVTLCSTKIFDAFYSDDKMKALYHGHSYTANPLTCAAANASLDIIEQAGFTDNVVSITNIQSDFAERLKLFKTAENKKVENIRQHGTILAFDVITPHQTGYFNTIRDEMYQFFIANGVLLRPLGNTIYIMPPYCINVEQMVKIHAVILAYLAQP
ncbi:MAG: adenosylmethionine--8-amino-7-oxononanoate transaminase [Chitinophagales bacterium]|nr:adenosylmethionine--8-amino-7-oxononanoate transaminase [Bacteroidota bacterium]